MRMLGKIFTKVGAFIAALGLMLGGLVIFGLTIDMPASSMLVKIGIPVAVLLMLIGYLMPTIIAAKTGHPNLVIIILLNIFAGWTAIGWIVSMFWSVQTLGARRCDQCKEIVRKDALVCKHCGNNFGEATAA